MRRVKAKYAFLFFLWIIAGGCSGDSREAAPTGTVEFSIDWSSTVSAKADAFLKGDKILNAAQGIRVTASGLQIITPITLCAGKASPPQVITFQGIPAGNDTFDLSLYNQSDCQGSKVDEATALLDVVANQVNPLVVTFTGQRVFNVGVTSAATEILIGGQMQFTAIAKNADGEILSGKTVSWSSSRPEVASIDSVTGSARGLLDGSTVITASIEGESGTLSLRVGAAAIPFCTVGGAPPPIPDIVLRQVTAGLVEPVHIAHSGDGSGRLFIVEKRGTIRSLIGGALQDGFFLDIRDRVITPIEMGLLSVAFHPNFSTNHLFYVNYSTALPLNGTDRRSVIAEFKAGATLAETAASERILLTIPHPAAIHNGGQLAFGPESQPYLYFGMGDGGDHLNGQKLTTLLGKVLRIDVDHKDAGLEYAIPVDNPSWSGVLGARREIWAYGFRNPWRFSFDPVTGLLYLGDVGENTREEIDIVRKGLNYGWDQVEGDICTPFTICDLSAYTPPLIAHPHPDFRAIIGGIVYRGAQIPNLCGVYLYGDFVTGTVRGLRFDGNSITDQRNLANFPSLASFGEDENHEGYVVNNALGTLFKIGPP